jgi:hypothetical protein
MALTIQQDVGLCTHGSIQGANVFVFDALTGYLNIHLGSS